MIKSGRVGQATPLKGTAVLAYPADVYCGLPIVFRMSEKESWKKGGALHGGFGGLQ